MKNKNKNIKIKKTTNKENVISREKKTECTRKKKRKNIIHAISLLKDKVK